MKHAKGIAVINRRTFLGASTVGAATILAGQRAYAATPVATPTVQFQNASFIRSDLSATPVAVPVLATPAIPAEQIELTGYLLGEAEHTLTLFADYRCPHCRVFHREVEPGLLADYVDTGKLQLELIDLTVVGVRSLDDLFDDTQESVQAAEAAAAAAEQNGFLAYREWLYNGPDMLMEGDFSDERLIAAAAELGLDDALFASTLTEGVYEQDIIASVYLALQLGVPGTPTLTFDRGEPFQIADGDYKGLQEILDDLLGA